jgi:predicted nuclease with RNAse H fold
MHIVGLDIGYSERRRTNAMAIVRDRVLTVMNPMFPSERDASLRSLDTVDVIAIDAPIVLRGTPDDFVRKCERIFIRSPFQRRCKPGMSHVGGTGRRLRAEGRRAADVAESAARKVVEAFPNAFLGVVLPEEAFANPPTLRRGGKFDWLYDEWRRRGLFRRVVAAAHLPEEIAIACETEGNHERRAALVCLLTAAFALQERCTIVGQPADGFFLPPAELWEPWALASLPVHISETSSC